VVGEETALNRFWLAHHQEAVVLQLDAPNFVGQLVERDELCFCGNIEAHTVAIAAIIPFSEELEPCFDTDTAALRILFEVVRDWEDLGGDSVEAFLARARDAYGKSWVSSFPIRNRGYGRHMFIPTNLSQRLTLRQPLTKLRSDFVAISSRPTTGAFGNGFHGAFKQRQRSLRK
jgi:hypothetical protein